MESNNKSIQKNMLFNTIGSLIYYFCQWMMTIVIVRISGYELAGVLSIAMSVTAAPAIVGLFNVRNYQVSDLQCRYSTKTYISSRVVTNILSYIICVIMVWIGQYDIDKVTVILVFMLFKVTEGFADVFYGVEQKNSRLDYAGISLAIRGLGAILLFVGFQYTVNSLVVSLMAVTLFSGLFLLVYDWRIVKEMIKKEPNITKNERVWELLWICVPLAIVAFLNNLSVNIPKIILERFCGSEVMGIYNSVASPTIVVQLAATTLFAPLVPVLTQKFNDKAQKEFWGILKKFSFAGIVLSVICLIGSKLLARLGLVFLFGEGILPYVKLFVPVILVSIIIAVNACLFSICTLVRAIKPQYFVGVFGVASSLVLAICLIPKLQMNGVVWTTLGTMLVQILIQVIIIDRKMRSL